MNLWNPLLLVLFSPLWAQDLRVEVVGKIDIDGRVNDLAVAGEFAYLTTTNPSGLTVIRISDSQKPVFETSLETPRSLDFLKIVNQNLSATHGRMLDLYLLDENSQPVLSSRTDTYDYLIAGMDLEESFTYLVHFKKGLTIYDVRPATPELVGNIQLPNISLGDVAVNGDYAYIGGRDDRFLWVWDVSDKSNPKLTSKTPFPEPIGANEILYRDGIVYIAGSDPGLLIFDVIDPVNPFLLGSYKPNGLARDVALMGTYALVIQSQDGLEIVAVSDPTNPTLQGRLVLSDISSKVWVDGAFAYVVVNTRRGFSSRMEIVKIEQLGPPTIAFQPADLQICPDDSKTLSVTANTTGSATFQWRRNGVELEGADGRTLTLRGDDPNTPGQYDCVNQKRKRIRHLRDCRCHDTKRGGHPGPTTECGSKAR